MKIRSMVAAVAAALLVVAFASAPAQAAKEIRWGTSRVGSSGHRALTGLTQVLGKYMQDYNFTVQPTPGAIVTVKGYATGQFEGYYGSDVAFWELANNAKRFEGFKAQMQRQPVQSFWAFTIEMGVGIHKRDAGKLKSWGDLNGQRVFTGPRPWDTRAQIERAFETLGVKHEYMEVDTGSAGALLEGGRYAALGVYTNAESTTAPWITEASLQTDWVALNPNANEIAALKKAGFSVVEIDPKIFGKKDTYAAKAVMLPFYYGFHVGMEVSEADVDRMLKTIEQHADELVQADKTFKQVAADMPRMQRRGVESSAELVPIHPGLAKYMREKGVWDAKWDSRVAKP